MRILLPLCLALAGLSAACTTPTQVQGLESSLDDIQTQVLKLQKDSAAQTEALEAVRDSLEAQDDQQREGWADVAVTVEALTSEMRVLQEQLQETQARLRELYEEMRIARQTAPSVVPVVPSPVEGGDAGADGSAQAAAPAAPTTIPSGPEELFNGAYADYSKRNYPLALWSFGEFLRRYPDSSQADDAQYWIGECHYAQGDYQAAVSAFEDLINRYPSGDKVPAAHLKAGLAYFELKQTAQGVLRLQHVVETYPGSDEARIASSELQRRGLSGT